LSQQKQVGLEENLKLISPN